ncbi:hypothetical protein [uncultured Draconibacterium sp.]|uniref:hypothetical protein n=1 Tax=uncultured Draconibacterium sp. TaxID=1573823 RepID=UPI0029C906C6|nr:hypothetical protein [uncultured Draconibacterium sp.]
MNISEKDAVNPYVSIDDYSIKEDSQEYETSPTTLIPDDGTEWSDGSNYHFLSDLPIRKNACLKKA